MMNANRPVLVVGGTGMLGGQVVTELSSMPGAPPVSQHPSHPPPNSYSSPDTALGSAVATTPQ
jgi:nucleoside-diphosphate-sugar epimerase